MGKPKTFSLHWGSGVIEEEAQIETPYHRPTVQLLRFTRGQARSPLILDAADVPRLGRALQRTPKLRRLLARLVR
jgi:hypothetical protein